MLQDYQETHTVKLLQVKFDCRYSQVLLKLKFHKTPGRHLATYNSKCFSLKHSTGTLKDFLYFLKNIVYCWCVKDKQNEK